MSLVLSGASVAKSVGGSSVLWAIGIVAMSSGRRRSSQGPPPPSQPSTADVLVSMYKAWFNVSQPLRFFISGNFGNIAFYFIERAVYFQLIKLSAQGKLPMFMDNYKDTSSFFIGYILQIVVQHWIHAFLVYGLSTINTRGKYFKTLFGQTSAYLVSLIGSTFLNLKLLGTGMNKTAAFVTTMWVFALVNYFVVGYIVDRSVKSSAPRNHLDSSESSPSKKSFRPWRRIRERSIAGATLFGLRHIASGFSESGLLHDFVCSGGPAVEMNQKL